MRRYRDDRSSGVHPVGPERTFATYNGTAGNDRYVGASGADTINGYGGDDTLSGADGDDVIDGGDGNDTIDGGTGHNTLRGGAGYNTITSAGGIDTVVGTGSQDIWYGRYSQSTDNLVFDETAGTLSNGTTLSGIDYYLLYTGYGDDTFNVFNGPAFFMDAGGSRDTANIDYSNTPVRLGGDFGLTATLLAVGDTFAIGLRDETRYSDTIQNVEVVNLLGTQDRDSYELRGAVDAGLLTLAIDGGGGEDLLRLDLHTVASTRFIVGGDGSITSTFGFFTSLETFTLTLGGGTNIVALGGGDDVIVSAGVNDRLDGGAGDDTISARGGGATIAGGDGTDTWLITGTDGLRFDQATLTDSIGTSVTGIERILINLSDGLASGGVYTLTGIGVSTTVDLDDDDNSVVLDLSNLTGPLILSTARDPQTAGFVYYAGNALVRVSTYAPVGPAITIVGTAFDDTFAFIDGAQGNVGAIDGGDGIDTLALDARFNNGLTLVVARDGTITSSLGSLVSIERFDLTLAFGTNIVTAGGYDDVITVLDSSSQGRNILAGADGDDRITAGRLSDSISGGNGDDLLIGNAGSDVLTGSAGRDILDGGLGRDTASYADAAFGVRVALVTGFQDTGGAGSDLLSSIENLAGSRYDDALTGNAGANRLSGSVGDDLLAGGDGDDQLAGGAGADRLTGGAGTDTFLFVSLNDFRGATSDRILDLSHADRDRIDLSRIDPDPASGDQAFTLIGNTAFTGSADRSELRVADAGDGSFIVQGDTNHDGTADFAFLVMVAEPLTAADFVL